MALAKRSCPDSDGSNGDGAFELKRDFRNCMRFYCIQSVWLNCMPARAYVALEIFGVSSLPFATPPNREHCLVMHSCGKGQGAGGWGELGGGGEWGDLVAILAQGYLCVSPPLSPGKGVSPLARVAVARHLV